MPFTAKPWEVLRDPIEMNVVFHIGLHKTASGTLQRQFFPACKNVNTLTTSQDETRAFIRAITKTDPAYFDGHQAAELLSPVMRDNQVNLISNESISGPPYAGVVERELDHRSAILENVRNTFPDSRIVIVLRRQDALARSMYRQYVKRGGTARISTFYGFDMDDGVGMFSRNRFRYLPYIQLLNKLFPERVLVLLFEEFVKDKPAFLRRLCEFIGTDVPELTMHAENASTLGPFGMEATRLANYFFQSMLNRGPIPQIPRKQFGRWKRVSPIELLHDYWPGKGKPGKRISDLCDRVLDEVRDDNRSLDREFGPGLSRFDYY